MSNDKKTFKFARKVLLEDFENGSHIYSADYTFLDEGGKSGKPAIYQCDLIEEEAQKNITFTMKPGVFKVEATSIGLRATKEETQKVQFLETSKVYEKIIEQIDAFYNNLHVYAKLGITRPKRGLLLHSYPGSGKSSAITRVAEHYTKDKKACVLIYPTDTIRPDDLEGFLAHNTDWSEIDRFILVMEDIGGGADAYGTQQTKTPAGLLNFLDGITNVFQKATFILATTNNADALMDTLTNRPGRFDEIIEIKPPNPGDRISFLKFFAKEDYNLSLDEEHEIRDLTEGFSIAHLKETFVRAMLLQRTMLQTAGEIRNHMKKVKEGLSKKPTGSVGFSGFGDFDE